MRLAIQNMAIVAAALLLATQLSAGQEPASKEGVAIDAAGTSAVSTVKATKVEANKEVQAPTEPRRDAPSEPTTGGGDSRRDREPAKPPVRNHGRGDGDHAGPPNRGPGGWGSEFGPPRGPDFRDRRPGASQPTELRASEKNADSDSSNRDSRENSGDRPSAP